MNILGTRIKELRKNRKLSQTDLSYALNQQYGLKTDRVMISKWETGFQTPVMSTIVCLARYFGVSIDYLNGEQSPTPITLPYSSPTLAVDIVSIPVIGEIAAGFGAIANEDWSTEAIEVPRGFLKGRSQDDFFFLKVHGDSMFPSYQDGDMVLILKQSTMNYSGQVGAVLYEDENATLKRIEYIEGEEWMRLVPINPNFAPQKIDGERLEHCHIIGVPKLVIRSIEE